MRKLVVFLLAMAMIGFGLYWALPELLWPPPVVHPKGYAVGVLAGLFPAFIGAYLLWVDFVAPALGIKTGEEPHAWEETYAQRIYDALPAPNDLGDITALRLRIPTALHQAYQNKIILQREMICFTALMSVATSASKLQPVMVAFGTLLVSKLDARGLQITRDQLADFALKDVEAMLTEPFRWGQRWLAEFRSDPKDNYMVALFADHCCRLFEAYKHSIESTQPK